MEINNQNFDSELILKWWTLIL